MVPDGVPPADGIPATPGPGAKGGGKDPKENKKNKQTLRKAANTKLGSIATKLTEARLLRNELELSKVTLSLTSMHLSRPKLISNSTNIKYCSTSDVMCFSWLHIFLGYTYFLVPHISWLHIFGHHVRMNRINVYIYIYTYTHIYIQRVLC